jgi:hypothetical protein
VSSYRGSRRSPERVPPHTLKAPLLASNSCSHVLFNAAHPTADTHPGDNEINVTVPVPREVHDDNRLQDRPVGRIP